MATFAAAHHERLDGTGYHRGLPATDAPARGAHLCVADICDALRASRPYREGLPSERVLDIMGREVGIALDAECVGGRPPFWMNPATNAPTAPAARLVPALAEDYYQAA